MFSDIEKKVLKEVVKNEMDRIQKTRDSVIDSSPSELAIEEKYDEVLKGILEKL